jgi:glycine dehydrogenase subunit 1
MASFTPHSPSQVKEMLGVCGAEDISQLFSSIPGNLRPVSFDVPPGRDEMSVLAEMKRYAERNGSGEVIFAGGGYYDHYIPAAVDYLSSRSEFTTAYTPYQPEASQGTLQAMFEYQTLIARISGMDVSNASLYDGGSALYEAVAMAMRINGRKRIVICGGVNPLFRGVVRTYLRPADVELIETGVDGYHTDFGEITRLLDDSVSALVLQSPNFFGMIGDHRGLFALAASKGVASIDVFNPLCAGVLESPGERGADIAVAEGQSLGMPLSFGGPNLGILAAKREYVRKMPGRIVGRTVDRNGKPCFVLTLQAREQHIRREKATSNICSNQALCALRAAIYLSLLGKDGLRRIGAALAERGSALKKSLPSGIRVGTVFSLHEFPLELPIPAAKFAEKMSAKGFFAGIPASLFYPEMKNVLVTAVTEKRTDDEIFSFTAAMRDVLDEAAIGVE